MEEIHIVWFKRDLRLHDHAPLSEAVKRGRVLPLYIIEPDLWAQPDMSGRQYAFLVECLEELKFALAAWTKPNSKSWRCPYHFIGVTFGDRIQNAMVPPRDMERMEF